MADDNPRRPHPGQKYRHNWIPVTPAAAVEKNHGRKVKANSAISRILGEASAVHKRMQQQDADRKAGKTPDRTPPKGSPTNSAAAKANQGGQNGPSKTDLSARTDDAIRRAVGKSPQEAPKPDPAVENLQKIYGDRLQIHDETGQAHAREFAKVPEAILRALAPHVGKIDLGHGSVADYMPHLRDVRPRGWPPDKTWEAVPGGYDPNERHLVAGGGLGHGSSSLVLHEGGHAVDHALGQASLDVDFVLLHSAATKHEVAPYFAQEGAAGLSEMWAEVFAAWVASRGEPPAVRDREIGVAIGLSGDGAASIGGRMASHFDKMLANLEA